jgi:hypothetical protein
MNTAGVFHKFFSLSVEHFSHNYSISILSFHVMCYSNEHKICPVVFNILGGFQADDVITDSNLWFPKFFSLALCSTSENDTITFSADFTKIFSNQLGYFMGQKEHH